MVAINLFTPFLTVLQALLSILHLTLVLLTTHCPTFAPYYDYQLLFILESFLLVLWLISFCILGAQVAVARAIGTFPVFVIL